MWLVGHSVPFVRSHVLQVWLTDISYFLGGNFWAKSGIRLDGWDETCELRAGHNLHGCCVGHDGLEDARMSVERENVKCNCLVNKVAMSLSFLKYQWPFEKCLLVVSTKFSNIYWTSRGYEVIDIFPKCFFLSTYSWFLLLVEEDWRCGTRKYHWFQKAGVTKSSRQR